MNYLNNDYKTLIMQVPTDSVSVTTNFNNEVVATIVIDVQAFEKLETEYRGLVQDTARVMHDYLECEDLHCSNMQCYEFREYQRNKYILER